MEDPEVALPIDTAPKNSPSNKDLQMFDDSLSSCKMLSQALESWSTGQVQDDAISEYYTELISNTNRVLNMFHEKEADKLTQLSAKLKTCLESLLSDDENNTTDEQVKRQSRWNSFKADLTTIIVTWIATVKVLKMDMIAKGSKRYQALKVDISCKPHGSNSAGNLVMTALETASERSGTPLALTGIFDPFKVAQSPLDRSFTKDQSYAITGGFLNNQAYSSKSIYRKLDEIFLQIGDVIKRTSFEGNLSFQAIQLLFVEKHQYNNGLEVFPLILIRKEIGDANSGQQEQLFYELEDLEDVTEGSVLKLRTPTDSKDFIVHNIQQGFTSLAKELNGIKKILYSQKMGSAQGVGGITSNNGHGSVSNFKFSQAVDQIRKSVSKSLNGIVASPNAVNNFKVSSILDDFAQIRSSVVHVRKLAVNQKDIIIQSIKEVSEMIEEYRSASASTPNSNTARLELNSQKTHIALETEKINGRMKDLQEIVEEMRIDVTQRKCKPGETKMTVAFGEALAIQQGLMSLRELMDECKPSWKKTWETELQSIVAEQQFLKERSKGLDGMEEDHEGLMQMLQSIKQVIEIQEQQGVRKVSRTSFSVPVPDANHEGIATIMQEILSVDANSKQRMEAIARSERIRQRERDYQEDPLSRELKTFIHQDKLHKTGGIEEIERQRELKNREILFSIASHEK